MSLANSIFNGVHTSSSSLLEFTSPLPFIPSRAQAVVDQAGDVKNLEITISLVSGHGEHERTLVQDAGDELSRSTVQSECVPSGEQEAQQHLKSANHGLCLGHDEDKSFRGGGWVGVDRNLTFNLQKRRGIDE